MLIDLFIISFTSRREVRQNSWVPLHKALSQVNVTLLDFDSQPYRERKVYVAKREKQITVPRTQPKRTKMARMSGHVTGGSDDAVDAHASIDVFAATSEPKPEVIARTTHSARRQTRNLATPRIDSDVAPNSSAATSSRRRSRRR